MLVRALYFAAPRRVELREIDLDTDLKEGEVLVRTEYSGISAGTEMLAFRGELDPELPLDETIGPLAGTFRYPFRYGYSCVGRVERSQGPLSVGSLVVALHPHQEWFVARTSEVLALDRYHDARLATLFPLVEAALQITLDAGGVLEEDVVVEGLGAVGLLTAILLGRSGASVLAAEPRGWRRDAAAKVGVQAVAPEDLPDRVRSRTDGRGVPLLVELSGNPDALSAGLALLAHEGCALVASWYGNKEVRLPLGDSFHRRRLTLRSTQVSTIPASQSGHWTVARRRAAARELLRELPLGSLASHELGLGEAQDAFEAIDRQDEGVLHVALRHG